MAKARARHQTINHRFKIFGALSQKFRHHRSKHHINMQAVLSIVELEIKNGHPAFAVTEYEERFDGE